jgi:acetyl-CoA acetyltransferase
VTVEDLARTAAKNYRAAAENPSAHRREPHSVDDVLDADPVVGPLTDLMLGPMSYGAAVCVLVSEEVARERGGEYVWVTGTGLNSDRYYYRDMERRLEQPVLKRAASTAFAEADVTSDEIDVAEIAAPTPTFELLGYETLGFCAENEAASLVEGGVTAPGGSLPVNLSGGLLATSPPNSHGLYQVVSAVRALEGELGDVDGSTALVADNDMHLGEPGRSDAVLVLEGTSA